MKQKIKVVLDREHVPEPLDDVDDTPVSLPSQPHYAPDETEIQARLARRDETLGECKSDETSWKFITPLPEVLLPDLVADGKAKCNVCGGRGFIRRELVGATYGETRWQDDGCRCLILQSYKYLNSLLPLRDRNFRCGTLVPSEVSQMPLEMQAEKIAYVKAIPDNSYLLAGPPGWSKSTLSMALYDQAVNKQLEICLKRNGDSLPDVVRNCFPVWRVYASDIVAKTKNYKYNDGNEPIVSVRKIEEAVRWGWVPRLFIEEIEKLGKLTDDRAMHLWELIGAIWDNNGQIVVTTNQTPEAFELMFGGDIYRRITRDGEGEVMNFFTLASEENEEELTGE